MAAHRAGRLLRRKLGRGDGIAGLETAAVGKLGARLDSDDRGGARQAKLAGKAPLAVEPIDILDHADCPLFDAAVALVMVDVSVDLSPRRKRFLSRRAGTADWP